MKKVFQKIFIALSFFFSLNSFAQLIPVDNGFSRSFIHQELNRILNSRDLDSFYQKLSVLKKTNNAVISIVHIGDSHIQPDFMTALIRNNLQNFFGNAGRGLVFPYQLAQSNSPSDIVSSSNTVWEFNRLAHPEIPIASGISGYCIRSNMNGASIDLSLKPDENGSQSFNNLKFFLSNNISSSWLLQANHNVPFLIKKEEGDSSVFSKILLEQSADSFSLSSLPSDSMKDFYGVSLENSDPGILYHSIGVNGARYESFNIAPLFWQQLAALNADLFIVSLGTNEAQKTDFDEAAFQQLVNLFLQKLKIASPKAAILITSPADSYFKRRRSNAIMKKVCTSLSNYCTRNHIPFWDLYRISNGHGSAYSWWKNGLMNKDRIHFTPDGYRIQGNLLFNAFAKGYNSYISRH